MCARITLDGLRRQVCDEPCALTISSFILSLFLALALIWGFFSAFGGFPSRTQPVSAAQVTKRLLSKRGLLVPGLSCGSRGNREDHLVAVPLEGRDPQRCHLLCTWPAGRSAGFGIQRVMRPKTPPWLPKGRNGACIRLGVELRNQFFKRAVDSVGDNVLAKESSFEGVWLGVSLQLSAGP